MKFGKELLRAVAASEPVVSADTWLDYKVLKKMLKNMPPEENDVQESVPEAQKIITSEVEREFFRALSNELKKVETRFTELKSKSLQLAEEFSNPDDVDPTELRKSELQERLNKCASAHLFVLLVENYAVLNYCGFTKILKKHDKLRSTHTKVRYMSKMVNDRNFAKFDDVRQALEKLEASFERLSKVAGAQNQPTTSNNNDDTGSASTPGSTYSHGSTSSSSTGNGNHSGNGYSHTSFSVGTLEGTKALSPSAGSAFPAGFDAQRKELEDIHTQGMDRLKSLAATALLSLEESDCKPKESPESQNGVKRVKLT